MQIKDKTLTMPSMNYGFATSGSISWFKVYVVTSAGNEKGKRGESCVHVIGTKPRRTDEAYQI